MQECFGEDAELAAQMVVAAVEGLQNGNTLTRNPSWPASSTSPAPARRPPAWTARPLVYDDETFAMHLSVFEAAIGAGAASIMPYGYSTVPYLGGDAWRTTRMNPPWS